MSDRRIIAIAVTPTAYDEILKLKGDETWTSFVIRSVMQNIPGGNTILEAEHAALPKKAEPKPKPEKKAKVEKPKAEKKAKVKKAKVEPADVGETPGAQAEEAAAIAEGLPSDVPGGDCPGFPAEG